MIVSAIAHVVFLAAGLVAFSMTPPFPDNEEAIAVEMVDSSALNQVTRGEKSAEKVQDQPLPRAERKSEIVEKKEAGKAKTDSPAPPTRTAEQSVADKAVAAPLPPPRPAIRPRIEEAEEPRPQAAARPEVKPAPKPEVKPEPKPELRREELAKLVEQGELQARLKQAEEEAKAAAKAKAEAAAKAKEKAEEEAETKAEAAAKATADADARAKAKVEADAKAKAAALAKAKSDAEAKAKRDAELARNFNANDIQKLLQSKEQAQSSGSSAPVQNRTASLGTQTGSEQKLSPSLRSQLVGLLRDQMERCFSPPVGASAGPVIKPVLDIRLAADGGLSADPRLIRVGGTPTDRAVADAASRAVRRCAPYRIPAQFAPYFNDWKVLNVEFDTTN